MKVTQEQPIIVLVGSFNPAIFHPAWFARHGLLPEDEAHAARIDLVHPELTQFTAEWLSVQVNQSRLQLATALPPQELPLRDVAVGILRLLSHTPISAIGINRIVSVELDSETAWVRVNDALAPKSPWADLLPSPTMAGVTMESPRGDTLPGRVTVRVSAAPEIPFGFRLNLNSHIDHPDGDTDALRLAGVLEGHYKRIQDDAKAFLPALLEHALGARA